MLITRRVVVAQWMALARGFAKKSKAKVVRIEERDEFDL